MRQIPSFIISPSVAPRFQVPVLSCAVLCVSLRLLPLPPLSTLELLPAYCRSLSFIEYSSPIGGLSGAKRCHNLTRGTEDLIWVPAFLKLRVLVQNNIRNGDIVRPGFHEDLICRPDLFVTFPSLHSPHCMGPASCTTLPETLIQGRSRNVIVLRQDQHQGIRARYSWALTAQNTHKHTSLFPGH